MRRRSNDVRYRAGAATHVGRVRTNNEDSYAVDGPLFAIADGMGGENAGEVASAMAVETLRARGRASADLVDAIKVANLAVFTRSIQDDASTGMGTTLTAALLDGDRLTLGHVGDSRGYS